MPTIGWSEDCPRCGGQGTFEGEVWVVNGRRMECSDCGYFYERIYAYDYFNILPRRLDQILGAEERRFRRVVAAETPHGSYKLAENHGAGTVINAAPGEP